MASSQDEQRDVGDNDNVRPRCPRCGVPMNRIKPNQQTEYGSKYQAQKFACIACGHVIARTGD
jgi:hypothetical protein